MRKFRHVLFLSIFVTLGVSLLYTQAAFAADGDVAKVDNLIKNIIDIITRWGGLLIIGIFVYGGILYGSSTGNPERLGKAKLTLLAACVGLILILGANVLAGVVTDTTNNALGK
jgi:hypothetical protein